MNLVLTFSRRYCTGVSTIAEQLGKRYNIPIYGKDYICKDIHNEKDLKEQNNLIKELAKNPCIIIGRGASEALKEQKNVINIYVYADKEDRIKRAMDKEGITKEEAKERVKDVDTQRIEYYERNTGKFWGDMDGYDIILDSSKYGIDNCAEVIHKYLSARDLV